MSFTSRVAKDIQVKSDQLILEAISLHVGFDVGIKWCSENKDRLKVVQSRKAATYYLDDVAVLVVHNDINLQNKVVDGRHMVSANFSYELIKPS